LHLRPHEKVTDEGGEDYMPPEGRIATFDNDGTLWIEEPAYVQLVFALDRVKRSRPSLLSGRTSSPSRPLSKGT
jgi:hypothetical protein